MERASCWQARPACSSERGTIACPLRVPGDGGATKNGEGTRYRGAMVNGNQEKGSQEGGEEDGEAFAEEEGRQAKDGEACHPSRVQEVGNLFAALLGLTTSRQAGRANHAAACPAYAVRCASRCRSNLPSRRDAGEAQGS